MAVKIRLQRRGKKKAPFYHIVIADSRSPRDGRIIEKIGTYNPLSNPSIIEINFDRTLYWLQQGAQPTDTCRSLLRQKGVLYKKHLLKGIKKGVLTETDAEEKFQKWLSEKQSRHLSKIQQISKEKKAIIEERIKSERKIYEERLKKLAEKNERLAKEQEKKEQEEKSQEIEVKEEQEHKVTEEEGQAISEKQEQTDGEEESEEKGEMTNDISKE